MNAPADAFEITVHPRSDADLRALLGEVQHSPFIGEITPDEVQSLARAGTIRFCYAGDVLAGFGAWITINDWWAEIGPVYTAVAYRGQGIGWLMFDTVMDAQHPARNLYGVTKNPVVKRMFEQRGFRQVSLPGLPLVLYGYLLRKLSLRKALHHARKFSRHDSVAHYVRVGRSDA